jgi:hypothetical protein
MVKKVKKVWPDLTPKASAVMPVRATAELDAITLEDSAW